MSYFNLSAITAPIDSSEGLKHAVLQSFFNCAESTENDRSRMGTDVRGGCWANEFILQPGSRYWTLKREKMTRQVVNQVKAFCENALKWLVDEGHIKSVLVNVIKINETTLSFNAVLTLNNGDTLKVDTVKVDK